MCNKTNYNAFVMQEMAWVNDLGGDELAFLRGLPFTVSIPTMNLIVVHAGMLPNIETQHQHWKHLCTV